MFHSELKKLGPLTSLVCGLITLAITAGLFIWQMQMTAKSTQTNSWPKCTGKINSTYKQKDNSTYASYNYVANGKEYRNSNIYFDVLASGSILPGVNDSYKVGQTVNVFYNPDKPTESVLRTGPQPGPNQLARYGMLAFFGLALIFGGARKMSERSQRRLA